MVAQRYQGRAGRLGKFTDASGDGRAHFTVRIGIDGESQGQRFQVFANFFGAVAQHHDDGLNAACAKVIDAAFNNCFVSERKKRLKRSHALRMAGGENNCCDPLVHIEELITKAQRHKGGLRLKVAQRAQRVLPRHLFAPLIDKVGVVERSSLDVSSFSRSMNLIVS